MHNTLYQLITQLNPKFLKQSSVFCNITGVQVYNNDPVCGSKISAYITRMLDTCSSYISRK